MSQFKGDVPNVETGTVLAAATAAVTANYGPFFIADRTYEVVEMSELHTTASSDTTPPTLKLEKLTGTTAPGSGTVISAGTGINLHSAANTVQTVSCSNAIINRGDRLSLKQTTTPTALAGVTVDVVLRPV